MSKPQDFFNYEDGALSSDGVPLTAVADLTGTPVYVYSASGLVAPLRELQKGLRGLDHQICFAVKANSNISVLQLLSRAGAGMDLVSGGELFRAETAGVPGERVVFSGVGKTPGEIAAALDYGRGATPGIFSFNVESVPELALIDEIARRAGRVATVALRFNPDIDAKTHPYISTGLKKNKFGLDRSEILGIARAIRDQAGCYGAIRFKGVSIHIGSQLLSLRPLRDSFVRLRDLARELDGILPEPLEFLDLGGGLGISYDRERTIPINKYCELINRVFGPGNHRSPRKGRPKKILLEPGRLLAGNAGVLLTSVLYRKQRKNKDFVIVDAAMNDLLRPSLYGAFHQVVPVDSGLAKRPFKLTDVVGPVCETGDCLASDRRLSASIGQGELLAILSSGAYGFTMAGHYNSRPHPPEVLLENGKIRLIRERESYQDLLRGEHLDKS